MIRKFILIKHIKVQNANAISSPYTIGFPAVTAWLGFMHNLQRYLKKTSEDLHEIELKSVGIVCHHFLLNTYKQYNSHRIVLSKKPPSTRKDKKFLKGSKSFIPESTCNLDCSLLIEHNIQINKYSTLYQCVNAVLNTMKIAGGDILNFQKMNQGDMMFSIDEHDESDMRSLIFKLMPGYMIKERKDLMIGSMEEGHDALESLLEHLKVTNTSSMDNNGNVYWEQNRKGPGWIVPIATGFHGITEIKKVKGQRDVHTPHRFAESIITLGEFIMPYRIQTLDEILWSYDINYDNNLYFCKNKYNNNNIKEGAI